MFYKTLKFIINILYHLLFRLKIEGIDNIPAEGPVIICGNHIHNLDPVSVIVTIKRPIHYLGKMELFKFKPFGSILRKMNVIALNRGSSDIEAYRAAVTVLKSQGVLGIFAQGRRMKELDIKAAKSGVAMFALKGGAQIVPLYIEGTYRPFSRLILRYGKPVDLIASKGEKLRTELLEEITEDVMKKISELSRENNHGDNSR